MMAMKKVPEGVNVELRIQEKLNKEEGRLMAMIEERTKKYITPIEDRLKVIWDAQIQSTFRERKAWQK